MYLHAELEEGEIPQQTYCEEPDDDSISEAGWLVQLLARCAHLEQLLAAREQQLLCREQQLREEHAQLQEQPRDAQGVDQNISFSYTISVGLQTMPALLDLSKLICTASAGGSWEHQGQCISCMDLHQSRP